jgi:uncharacterized protein YuzE
MKLTYDPRYNIAYIKLGKGTGTVHSIKVSESVVIDLAADGSIHGIELLNANEQLYDKDGLHVQLINEATGEERDIDMAA